MSEQTPEHHLRNLLAIIHHDGGHYADEHGLEKATENAIQAWCDRSVQIDALETENAEFKAKLEAMERDLNNANIFLAERDKKLERQAEQITRLETSRACLREALAATQQEKEE